MSRVVQTGALAPRAPLRQQQRLRSLAVPVPMHNLPSFHGFRPRGADPTPLSASARSAGRTLRAKVRAPPTRCPLTPPLALLALRTCRALWPCGS